MPRHPSVHPTELELQILKILWGDSPQTARQIREKLRNVGRKLAHTSVITTLQKMVDKRQLKQLDAIERKALRFSPQISECDVSKRMLTDIVNRVFDGSAEAVMLSLFDVGELDESAVKRLRRALNDKTRGQQS
jgi:BlaI family penicillinase repressor